MESRYLQFGEDRSQENIKMPPHVTVQIQWAHIALT
jgi:hypothetical protein